jgi:hypothetical protein
MMNAVVNKLGERPWSSDILKVEGQKAYISGGERQGLKVGDRLAIMREGDRVKSQQTGFEITLPPTRVGALKVVALFGDSEANEGAVCDIVEGGVPAEGRVFVTDKENRP